MALINVTMFGYFVVVLVAVSSVGAHDHERLESKIWWKDVVEKLTDRSIDTGSSYSSYGPPPNIPVDYRDMEYESQMEHEGYMQPEYEQEESQPQYGQEESQPQYGQHYNHHEESTYVQHDPNYGGYIHYQTYEPEYIPEKVIKIPLLIFQKMERPKIRIPKLKLPKIKFPKLPKFPKIKFPKLPKMNLPRLKIPKVEFKKIIVPKMKLPIIELYETKDYEPPMSYGPPPGMMYY